MERMLESFSMHLLVGLIVCFHQTLAYSTTSAVRSVCAVNLQDASDNDYFCTMKVGKSSDSFVLTSKLAPNVDQINIYGWRSNFQLRREYISLAE